VEEYLAAFDDTAFGAATDVVPKLVSSSDHAARWTGAFFTYSTNYLFDAENGIIVDGAFIGNKLHLVELGITHPLCGAARIFLATVIRSQLSSSYSHEPQCLRLRTVIDVCQCDLHWSELILLLREEIMWK
jgi:cytochrome c556